MSHSAVSVRTLAELQHWPTWTSAFANLRKDSRYYEIVERSILQGFEYRYFAITDAKGTVRSVQPFFTLDQDLLAGTGSIVRRWAERIRCYFPRFLVLRTLMVGSAAGEAHLDAAGAIDAPHALANGVLLQARKLKAKLIVLKEFPADYRRALSPFLEQGFTRVPSMPMTNLDLNYRDFNDYFDTALSKATRKDLRRKFKLTQGANVEMSVLSDISGMIDELYPLYLQVFERSDLRFEKLTKPYLCGLGQHMPDKVRFFVWRQNGKAIAFSVCMLEGDAFYDEYIGLDYDVAYRLALYHYTFRDLLTWAIANGYRHYRSSALNYEPKLHLGSNLRPLDLYVRHTSSVTNWALGLILPFIEPVRWDKTLARFSNYEDLWRSL